jgi:hypothetical protein
MVEDDGSWLRGPCKFCTNFEMCLKETKCELKNWLDVLDDDNIADVSELNEDQSALTEKEKKYLSKDNE